GGRICKERSNEELIEPPASLARCNLLAETNFVRSRASSSGWNTVEVEARALIATRYSFVSTLRYAGRVRRRPAACYQARCVACASTSAPRCAWRATRHSA